MTHAALSPLIGPEFDKFLGASIGDEAEHGSASFPRSRGSMSIPVLAGSNELCANAQRRGCRAVDRAD